jgi:flagellar hook-associated protein 1 FlgK
MSFSQALSSAMSGLKIATRGTGIVAGNIANAGTVGYNTRQLMTAATIVGGVGITGIFRATDAALLAQSRSAASQLSDTQTRLAFLKTMQTEIGQPGEAGALTTALTEFQSALVSAASRPEDEIRLSQVLNAAESLAGKLNNLSTAVENARSAADGAIAADVASLNSQLESVADLNRRITILQAQGGDASTLMDERQRTVDRISEIVPVTEVERQNGNLALFTASGAVLLDGTQPTVFSFTPTSQVTAEMTIGQPLGQLSRNGMTLTNGQASLLSGGSLSANFSIRDELGPQIQAELDALAFDLQARLADPSVEPGLSGSLGGLFTDGGIEVADISSVAGLAGRLGVNTAVAADGGGALWKIRSGIGATAPSEAGDATYLLAAIAALDAIRNTAGTSALGDAARLEDRFSTIEARVSQRRVEAELQATQHSSRSEAIQGQLLALGVDSDAEMQALLQYEQAYAANARVIQAIDDMLSQILRL